MMMIFKKILLISFVIIVNRASSNKTIDFNTTTVDSGTTETVDAGTQTENPYRKNICWNGVQNFARMCYYTDWSAYRRGKGHFEPRDINYELCTHIIYSFAFLKNDTMDDIVPGDEKMAIQKDFYGKVTKLKEKNVTVVLSLGGWTDSTSKYSVMMADPVLRAKLVSNIGKFLIKHKFDGLDLDLEYPGYYQMKTRYPNDKKNFLYFLRDLRTEFSSRVSSGNLKKNLTLSVAVTGNEEVINIAYDVYGIAEICDWVHVMTYDMHSRRDPYTGLHAPFSQQPGDKGRERQYNVQAMMNNWLIRGALANKLVVGIPFYGHSFLLANESLNGLHAPANGVPSPGKFMNSTSSKTFYEIIDSVKNDGWSVVHENYLGSYAYKGQQWVGYDDKFDVAVKAAYIRMNCFYGAAFWAIELDCFQKDCPVGSHPLLSTVKDVLTGTVPYEEVQNCT